jgi:hypothetical protein
MIRSTIFRRASCLPKGCERTLRLNRRRLTMVRNGDGNRLTMLLSNLLKKRARSMRIVS